MVWVLVLAAVAWAMLAAFGAPVRLRLAMLGLLYFAVLAGLLVSPRGIGAALGGSLGEWLVLGGLAAAAWAYARGLRVLKRRARPAETAASAGPFSKTELARYARHIILREIGGPGQKRLKQARVLVIGAGGLGAPALQYLAAAGVGTVGVIDDDVVDNSNLQRQVIHKDAAIGTPKVFSAEAEMAAQNPAVTVRPYNRRLTEENAEALFADYDLILDGADNFETRYLANAVAARVEKPLISGALSQWEGQISLFDPAGGTPCYQCVFPQAPAPGLAPSCAEAGVLGPLPGVIGAMMAVEAIKHIAGAGQTLKGRMLIYDALHAETRIIRLAKRADCPVCGGASAL